MFLVNLRRLPRPYCNVAPSTAFHQGLVDFGATLALTTGLVFIATSLFNLGRNMSPLPEPRKKHQLIVSGIYGKWLMGLQGGIIGGKL